MESRDTRGERNRKQGVLNYGLRFGEGEQGHAVSSQDLYKLKDIIFKGKPKRVFRSTKNQEVSFQDPKRVHTALREFNDITANKVFTNIIEQMHQMENEQKQPGMQRRGTQSQPGKEGFSPLKAGGSSGSGAGGSIDTMETADVMASVEKMLASEKTTMQSLPKAAAHHEFDLNEGIVSVSKGAAGTGGGGSASK